MNTFAKLSFLIATVPASLALAGETKDEPKEDETKPGIYDEVTPERVKQVKDALYSFEQGTFDIKSPDLGGLIPHPDRMDPGPSCLGPISAFGRITKPLVEEEILGMRFGVDVVGDLGLVSDASRMGAEASLGIGLEFGGLSLGEHRKGDPEGYMRPLEVRFDALTHPSGDSDLSVSLYAFGYQLADETVASTSNALVYGNGFAWNLPLPEMGSWGSEFDCNSSGTDCNGMYGFGYEAVATVSTVFTMSLDATTGITTAAAGGVHSFAEGNVSGSWGTNDTGTFGISQRARFDLIHGSFSARGRIAPHNAHWIVDAEQWATLEDTLEGRIRFEFDVPDWIPFVPDVVTFTPFELAGHTFNQRWSYQCTIEKPF
jgi:hypothetical protein